MTLDGSTHYVGCGKPNGPHAHAEPEHPALDTPCPECGCRGLMACERCECHPCGEPYVIDGDVIGPCGRPKGHPISGSVNHFTSEIPPPAPTTTDPAAVFAAAEATLAFADALAADVLDGQEAHPYLPSNDGLDTCINPVQIVHGGEPYAGHCGHDQSHPVHGEPLRAFLAARA